MVSINTLQIDTFAEKIDVDVSTTSGNTITNVYVWKSEDFKDYSKAIDLSSLLEGTDETESFAIFAQEHLNVEKITGLWFIEFQSDEDIVPDDCSNNSNTAIGVVANLIPYHECVLNKLLSIEVDDCKPVVEDNCDECSGNIYYINTLLTALNEAIRFGYYEEAIRIIKNLDDLCDVCHTCPDYGDTLLINGLGFATINNSITDVRVEESTTFTPTFNLLDGFSVGGTQPAPSFVIPNTTLSVTENNVTTIVPFTDLGNSQIQLNSPISRTAVVNVTFANFIFHQGGGNQRSFVYSEFTNDSVDVPVQYAS